MRLTSVCTPRPKNPARGKLAGAGFGIHWRAIDADLSEEKLFRGPLSPLPQALSS